MKQLKSTTSQCSSRVVVVKFSFFQMAFYIDIFIQKTVQSNLIVLKKISKFFFFLIFFTIEDLCINTKNIRIIRSRINLNMNIKTEHEFKE